MTKHSTAKLYAVLLEQEWRSRPLISVDAIDIRGSAAEYATFLRKQRTHGNQYDPYALAVRMMGGSA